MADDQWAGLTDTPQTSSSPKKRKNREDQLPVKRKTHLMEGSPMEGVRKYFIFIKKRVSSDWRDLAFCLGFERGDIRNIAGRNQDDKSRCMDLLEEWLERNGERATIEVLMKALSDIELKSTVDGLKKRYPELSLCCSDAVLPVKLHLEQQMPAGDIDVGKQVQARILELERTLFTVDVLRDPELYRRTQEVLLEHKTFLLQVTGGSVILLLRFLRQTDVDGFYHNHYRVGEGTLSQQLSHILISDELRDKVKGAQLIVRLHVKYEDYVRVRDRLGQGLDRTTSVDNLLALSPPSRQVDRSSLRALDLALVSREDRLCSDGTTLNFTAKQVQAVVKTGRKKSEQQARQLQQLQIQQKQMQTAREDTEAMVRSLSKEVTRLTQQKGTAEKILGEHKLEIQQLQEANKSMVATIEEQMNAKPGKPSEPEDKPEASNKDDQETAMQTSEEKSQQMEFELVTTSIQNEEMLQKTLSEHKEEIQHLQEVIETKELRIETMLEDIKTAREQTEANVFGSVTKEIASLRKTEEEAQKILQQQREEIQKLQETNKNMAAQMEELTAENTKMSNQLTEVPDLREEVRKWREKDEGSQKVLSEQKLGIQTLQVTQSEELLGAAKYTKADQWAQPITPLMPDRSQLHYIKENAGRKWRDLARGLGFSETDIEVFEYQHPTDLRNSCMEMLTAWQRWRKGTTGVLKEALRNAGLKEIADNLDLYKDQLYYIKENAGRKWKDLARRLGFSETDIEVFEDKHPTDLRGCCIEMLTNWRERTGKEGTVGVLKEALEKAGLEGIAYKLEFRYDAFVVHSSEDSAWVNEWVQQLESPPHNLRIFNDDRDFMLYDSYWAIANSRRILLVLSQNFLSSPWCEYELKAAIETKGSDKNCVVPILRSKCRIPDELAHLTYLDCTDGTVDVATLASNIRSNVEKKVTTV